MAVTRLLFEPKIKGKKRLVQSLAGAVLVFGNAPFHDAGHEQLSAGIVEIQAKAENNLAHYARQMLFRISHSQSECNPLGFTQSLTVNDVLKSDLQLVGRELLMPVDNEEAVVSFNLCLLFLGEVQWSNVTLSRRGALVRIQRPAVDDDSGRLVG